MKFTSGVFVAILALVAFYFVAPKAKAAGNNENYSYSNSVVKHSNNLVQSSIDNDVCGSCGEVIVNNECNCQPIIKEIRVPVVNIVRCQKVINVPCVRPVIFRKVFVPKTVCVPQIVINRSCPIVSSGCPAGCP